MNGAQVIIGREAKSSPVPEGEAPGALEVFSEFELMK
jgi:hypothetical protein